MSATTTEGVWLSITDYSQYKGVSVSTIRRHIKNNILKYKEENGKYFIYVASFERIKIREEGELLRIKLEMEHLRSQVRSLQEENNELRMLVNIYEDVSTPPEISGLHL